MDRLFNKWCYILPMNKENKKKKLDLNSQNKNQRKRKM